jgi:aspartyl-tRNA synthetase
MSVFLATHTRTHSCGALRANDVGKQVVLTGWVKSYRDHRGCVFIDLRDREGVTQLVFDESFDKAAHEASRELRSEWCIGITGEVRSRGEMLNDKLATGAVEIWIKGIEVFSRAETPPFQIEDSVDTNEALRLKYRYLDLRRPKLQKNLILRSAITRTTRDYVCRGRIPACYHGNVSALGHETAGDPGVPLRVVDGICGGFGGAFSNPTASGDRRRDDGIGCSNPSHKLICWRSESARVLLHPGASSPPLWRARRGA